MPTRRSDRKVSAKNIIISSVNAVECSAANLRHNGVRQLPEPSLEKNGCDDAIAYCSARLLYGFITLKTIDLKPRHWR